MTNSNPKSLLKLYKYNSLRLSSTEMNNIFIQSQAEETTLKETPWEMVTLERDSDKDEKHIKDFTTQVMPQI